MTASRRAELDAFSGATLPDLAGPNLRLLFVGINPGLSSVAVQAPFAPRGNRFYPALLRAGIVDRLIDASAGFGRDDLAHLHARGVGITSLVAGASARAADLRPAELVAGVVPLTERVGRLRPAVVAMLGISAYRVAFAQPTARIGHQPADLAGVPLWVVPNPSGLNRHATLAVLADAYREVAIAAGIDVFDIDPRKADRR